ncbi:uncharacterized protein [Callorhinus ursinus]|uniref:uncharacterized protein n=1 Tax=Callorhinus ursinus TaxID=34884 RepID=UPI003CD02C05
MVLSGVPKPSGLLHTGEVVSMALDLAAMCKTFEIPHKPNVQLKICAGIHSERDTAREGTQAGGVGEGEAGFPRSREPDAGLDPRTLGSRPEPKAAAQPTEPPSCNILQLFTQCCEENNQILSVERSQNTTPALCPLRFSSFRPFPPLLPQLKRGPTRSRLIWADEDCASPAATRRLQPVRRQDLNDVLTARRSRASSQGRLGSGERA